jgi:hypothetical protein
MTADSDGLAAALIQISAHAERIASLDSREASHYDDIASRLSELAVEAASLTTSVDGIGQTLTRHGAVVEALDGLDAQVATVARQLAELAGDEDGDQEARYQPVPPPRWWKTTGPERDAAIDRLRAWIDQVYRPGYGQVAAMLPACWEQHPLCLYVLDWLTELWSVLYLGPARTGGTLAAQAEWQTRLLPAAAEQMAYEATRCGHATATRQPTGAARTSRRTTDGSGGWTG